MKNNFNNKFLTGCLLAMSLLAACSEEDIDQNLNLSITGITNTVDLNTPITQAQLGEFIAIHGSGMDLRYIDSILVNDIRVDMLDVYAQNDILYMPIPVKVSVEITDRIYIYKKKTKTPVEYPFNVLMPEIKLTRMFNEYTQPGDTIMIYGEFFNLYEVNEEFGEVDFGGLKSKVITSSDTYLTTQVPPSVGKNVDVKVRSLKYDRESTCPGRYRDENFMIMNFDDAAHQPSSMQYVVTDDKTGNKYLMLNGKEDWSGWWYIAEKGGISYSDDMLDHPEKYQVKCEFFTSNQFISGKIGFFIYTFWDAPPMVWKPESFIFQNFNRWETIRLPFVVERSTTYPENFRHTAFNIRLEIDPNIARYFAFDNIRICRIEE